MQIKQNVLLTSDSNTAYEHTAEYLFIYVIPVPWLLYQVEICLVVQ